MYTEIQRLLAFDMRRIFYLFAIAVTTLSLASCDKDKHGNDLGITFSDMCDMAPIFSADGGERRYTFTTDYDWSIETFDEWVSVTPESGSSPDELSFSLRVESHDSGEERHSHILMRLSNGKAVKIPIVQLMRERFDVADTEIYTISEDGGVIDVEVATNLEYTVFTPKGIDWLTHEVATRTMRDETLSFDISPNTAPTSRAATIYVRANDYEATLLHSFTIVQSAEGEARNEIIYTTSDREPIELSFTEGFGSRFIAHHWDDEYGRIIFEDDVTTIPYRAFRDQTEIYSITLPAGVTAIESEAFSGCNGMPTFTIPAKVERIDEKAFEGCRGEIIIMSKLANNAVPTTDERHWLYGSEFSTATCHNTIGDGTFAAYSPLEYITFMEGVRTVGNDAFDECINLKSVEVASLEQWCDINFDNAAANPIANNNVDLVVDDNIVTALDTTDSGITAIGKYAFAHYDNLEAITLDDDVKSIGWGSFEGCTVEHISLGNSIISIGSYAFNNATTESLTIEFDIPALSADATNAKHWFYGLTTPEVTFGNEVASIGTYALSKLTGIATVNIGDNVEYIGEGAFANCTELTELNIGKGVKTLDKHALFNCEALTKVTLPEGITTLGSYAFDGCKSLSNTTIPASVTAIGEYTFNNCDNLADVYCHPVTPPSLGNIYVFGYHTTIHVSASAYDAYTKAENWKRLTDRIIGDL